jgi:hypothetical protein
MVGKELPMSQGTSTGSSKDITRVIRTWSSREI